MNLTVVIPFRNGNAYLKDLVNSIPEHLPILVVNDQSDQPPIETRAKVLHLNKRKFFSGAVNVGIENTKTDVLILNQDTVLDGTQWLDLIVNLRNHFALIGEGVFGHPSWPAGYVHGTFMYMQRGAIDKVGLLNEDDYPLWGSTCEWQLRMCRHGYNALPVRKIPGFTHFRKGQFGNSVKAAIEEKNDKRLLRIPPEISIIIPNYNHGKYLHDALDSLMKQTFQSFEIIFVDDASTDNSKRIISSLLNPWAGIRGIFHKKNKGTPSAQNTGIRLSYSPWLTILNADDMMAPDRLEYLFRETKQDFSKVLYDNVTIYKEGDVSERWDMAEYDFEKLLLKNQMHAGIMFSRKAWETVGGYPEEMEFGREDWAFNVALGINGFCGVKINKYGYIYRREGQNRTLRNTTPAWHLKFSTQLRNLFPNIYAGERPIMCCGGRKTKAAAVQSLRTAVTRNPDLPGKDGMTLIQYVGTSVGSQSRFGHATGTRYEFGLDKPIGYVDNRDLKSGKLGNPGLLEMTKHGKNIFIVHKSPKTKPEIKPVPEPELDPIEATEGALKLLAEYGKEKDIILIEGTGKNGKITVPDVRAYLKNNE